MNDRLTPSLVFRAALVASALLAMPAAAQAPSTAPAAESEEKRDPPPPLPADVLKDPKVISGGEAIWKENCQHCHGSKAYPGKAPKLQPTKYKPEFVWDRVHNGFRSMPAWKELYNDEQVISIVAWVMSAEFWP